MGATTDLVRRAASASARPISPLEFSKAWSRIWPKPRKSGVDVNPKTTFGLAVSGGVDSMALAFLCSRMRKGISPENGVIEFRAFVVDHIVRSGSDVEALAVSRSLEERGIPSDVLKLQWLGSTGLSNFESSAREHRFRALGKACRQWGINSLLLAHHEDDQVETIMMRLMEGHRLGLSGIKEHLPIPECYGVHGVHESGGLDGPAMESPIELKPNALKDREAGQRRPIAETGGVRVYRPLLGFSKERLIATCEENDVRWFEDHTNKDQTLTKRNAIRHMLAHHSLPKALSKPALLDLSERMKEREQHREDVLAHWLSKCCIMVPNFLGGGVKVRFASLAGFREDPIWPGEVAGQTAAEILRTVITLVTHREHVTLSSLHGAVSRVFPELSGEQPRRTSFTACGVYFQHLPPDAPNGFEGIPPAAPGHEAKPAWLLSRQPFMLHQIARSTLTFPHAGTTTTTTTTPDSTSEETGCQWSPFQLFDGRYWIRIQTNDLPPQTTVLVKPFQETFWPVFRKEIGRGYFRAFKTIKEKAPGSMRWTLPAVVLRDENGVEKAVGLPTLDVFLEHYAKKIKAEVRYKNVYYKGLRIVADDTVVRKVTS